MPDSLLILGIQGIAAILPWRETTRFKAIKRLDTLIQTLP